MYRERAFKTRNEKSKEKVADNTGRKTGVAEQDSVETPAFFFFSSRALSSRAIQ